MNNLDLRETVSFVFYYAKPGNGIKIKRKTASCKFN